MVDPQSLPSWNDGAAKSAILGFVARVTNEGGAEFAPPAERIAVFDNDGTLCCEQPLQIQFYFAFGRVEELAAKDPALAERQPFKAVLEHDYNTLFGLGLQALYELAFATHAGITDEELLAAGLRRRSIPRSAGCLKNASIGRRSSCSHTYGRTVSRLMSCRQAAWTSCARSSKRLTACHGNR
jgi:hypothetical protein